MANPKLVTSNEVVVEKGVPIPSNARGGHKYPLTDLEVGDSFKIDRADMLRVRSAMNYFQNKTGRKFTMRNLPNEVRVWRVS